MARQESACDKISRLTESRQAGPLEGKCAAPRKTELTDSPTSGWHSGTYLGFPSPIGALPGRRGRRSRAGRGGRSQSEETGSVRSNIDRPLECLQGVRPSRVVVGPVSSRTAPVHRVAASRQSRLTITGGQIDRHDETSPAAMGRLSPGPFLLRSLHDMNTLR